MSKQFRLPDLGEGLVEGEIARWLVSVGDAVTLNQPVAEVETAKAIVELPSPYAGTVLAIHAEPGETVPVGAPLVTIAVEGEVRDDAAGPPAEHAEDRPEPMLVGYGAPRATQARPARRRRRAPGEAAVGEAGVVADERPVRPRSTPPVRAYARRLGVDLELLSQVVGGRAITREDVDAHLGRPAERALPDRDPAGATGEDGLVGGRGERRLPVRGVRKQTAAAMVRSASTAPQVTLFHTVDVTAAMSVLSDLRSDPASTAPPAGLLALASRAACLALREVPEVNASWDEEAGEIVQHAYVDLGIAVATDRGLIVPHIRDAHALGLGELARELAELVATGRAGRTPLDRLSGGTFSITNIGVFGVDSGTPLLPPGQSGILALGAVRRLPWEHEGAVALRDMLTLSLTIDHRVIDGAEGARCLKAVGDLLEHPARVLLQI